MTTRRAVFVGLAAGVGAAAVPALSPPPAAAFNPVKPLCMAGGLISGAIGKACSVASTLLGTGSGGSSAVSKASTAVTLAAVAAWVLGGAKFALEQTAHVIGHTTAPHLASLWFSSTYWRVAGISALLTLPFLFAAAIQALLRSDLALLTRSAFGYLPLAGLAVGIAAPLTTLLLSASDELSSVVASAGGDASGHFLGTDAGLMGGLGLMARSPFLVFFAGLLTVAAALVLWLELLMRACAVYVIVLMLPLAFAAMVWPARRVWAVRAVEVLLALILSKFLIVAVLSLGGAAISQSAMHSVTGLIAGVTLLGLGICAPWALLRLLPMAELAAGAAGALRREATGGIADVKGTARRAENAAETVDEWLASASAHMRRDRDAASEQPGGAVPPGLDPPVAAPPGPSPGGAVPPGRSPGGAGWQEPPPAPGPAPPLPASAADEHANGQPPPWEADDMALPTLVLGPPEDTA